MKNGQNVRCLRGAHTPVIIPLHPGRCKKKPGCGDAKGMCLCAAHHAGHACRSAVFGRGNEVFEDLGFILLV